MKSIRKIFNDKAVIFNPVQPFLLDFVNDPFLAELLPNLTQYISLAKDPKYHRHAFEKSKEIVNQLINLQKKSQKTLINQDKQLMQ
jgi:hypothetical protein